MYSTIGDIKRQINELRSQRSYLVLYWFEMGETDKSVNLPPQYPDNYWYMMGYYDREYQLAIGFNPTPVTFEHF
jgi:hypothetical protein